MPPYKRSQSSSRRDDGFIDADDITVPQRLIASIIGPGGCGKSTLALREAPGPIVALVSDPNTRFIARQVKNEFPDKVIKFQEFKRPFVSVSGNDKRMQDDASAEFERFEDVVRDILQGELDFSPKTCVIDNATTFYDLLNIAEFGRTSQIQWYQRTVPNRRFYDLIAGFESSSMNLILVHQASEVWEDRVTKARGRGGLVEKTERVKVTGKWEREGFKKVDYLVQVEACMLKDPERSIEEDDGGVANKFGLRILKCTQNTSIEGTEVWGVTPKGVRRASFPFLARMVYPETKLTDWR